MYIDSIAYLGGRDLAASAWLWNDNGAVQDAILYSPNLGVSWELRSTVAAKRLRRVGDTSLLASDGTLRSTDDGATWETVAALVEGAAPHWSFDSIAWNQREGSDSVILASGIAGNLFTPSLSWGLWKSEDGGTEWRRITVETGVPDGAEGPSSVAIDPYGQAMLVLSEFGAGSHVFKSRDAGETWMPATDPSGGYALGVMYLGQNPPPTVHVGPSAGPTPTPIQLPAEPPTNDIWEYEFHDEPCQLIPPTEGPDPPCCE